MHIKDGLTILLGGYLPLDAGGITGGKATTGADKDLYNALVDLGWKNDCTEG